MPTERTDATSLDGILQRRFEYLIDRCIDLLVSGVNLHTATTTVHAISDIEESLT